MRISPPGASSARDHTQDGALAAARWPDEHHKLLVSDIEVDAVDDRLRTERLAQLLETDGRHDAALLAQLRRLSFWQAPFRNRKLACSRLRVASHRLNALA